MSTEKPIAYEAHPVSAERKAELVAEGFRIVDAIYQPATDVDADVAPEAPTEKAPRKSKSPKSEA